MTKLAQRWPFLLGLLLVNAPCRSVAAVSPDQDSSPIASGTDAHDAGLPGQRSERVAELSSTLQVDEPPATNPAIGNGKEDDAHHDAPSLAPRQPAADSHPEPAPPLDPLAEQLPIWMERPEGDERTSTFGARRPAIQPLDDSEEEGESDVDYAFPVWMDMEASHDETQNDADSNFEYDGSAAAERKKRAVEDSPEPLDTNETHSYSVDNDDVEEDDAWEKSESDKTAAIRRFQYFPGWKRVSEMLAQRRQGLGNMAQGKQQPSAELRNLIDKLNEYREHPGSSFAEQLDGNSDGHVLPDYAPTHRSFFSMAHGKSAGEGSSDHQGDEEKSPEFSEDAISRDQSPGFYFSETPSLSDEHSQITEEGLSLDNSADIPETANDEYLAEEQGFDSDPQDSLFSVETRKAPGLVGKRLNSDSARRSPEIIGKKQAPTRKISSPPGFVGKRPAPGFVGKRPAPGFVGKRPAPGFVGKRPAPGFVGKRPAPAFVGKRPAPGFVGKRPAPGFVGKRPAPGFVGKRPAPAFVGKRPAPAFVGKRPAPAFVGKRPAPAFVGKRPAPAFVGKRPAPAFVGKRPAPAFVGKRPAPAFVGKRPAPAFVSKRPAPAFVGKRPAPAFVGKRPAPAFVGKRPAPAFVGKRPASAFVGKRPAPAFVGKRSA